MAYYPLPWLLQHFPLRFTRPISPRLNSLLVKSWAQNSPLLNINSPKKCPSIIKSQENVPKGFQKSPKWSKIALSSHTACLIITLIYYNYYRPAVTSCPAQKWSSLLNVCATCLVFHQKYFFNHSSGLSLFLRMPRSRKSLKMFLCGGLIQFSLVFTSNATARFKK